VQRIKEYKKEFARKFFAIKMSKATYKKEECLIFRFIDVSELIQTQNKKMQSMYQDALTATFSHEQLNPLNSIINLTASL